MITLWSSLALLLHDEDAVSLAMFWAGLLMVFTPIVSAGTVIGVWWWQRRKGTK